MTSRRPTDVAADGGKTPPTASHQHDGLESSRTLPEPARVHGPKERKPRALSGERKGRRSPRPNSETATTRTPLRVVIDCGQSPQEGSLGDDISGWVYATQVLMQIRQRRQAGKDPS